MKRNKKEFWGVGNLEFNSFYGIYDFVDDAGSGIIVTPSIGYDSAC
jgi:hypothetical protein